MKCWYQMFVCSLQQKKLLCHDNHHNFNIKYFICTETDKFLLDGFVMGLNVERRKEVVYKLFTVLQQL